VTVAEVCSSPAPAPTSAPACGDRRRRPAPAHLRFLHGPMDGGKSTLALQADHNQRRQGRHGLLVTRGDRSAGPQISSRVGLSRGAIEIAEGTDLRLLEVADDVQRVQVEALCWCGLPGRLNARVVDGAMIGATVCSGETVVVADGYRVLCRRHHVRGELGPPQPARVSCSSPDHSSEGQRGGGSHPMR
jgi:thymidine kinase